MPTLPTAPAVAIVHDHIVQRGGGERVLLAMTRAFPEAPVYTSFYRPDATFPEFGDVDVRPMAINLVGPVRMHHRAALPLFPALFNRLRVEADVLICSSSGWAQGATASGRKIVYFNALAQWVHSADAYVAAGHIGQRAGAAALRPWLRRWDRRTASTGDRFLVCGATMQERVRATYGFDAEVLPPVVGVDPEGPEQAVAGTEPGFFFAAGRLAPSKNLDRIIEAFAGLPNERLVVAGEGRERARLEALAPANVRLIGEANDQQMRWLYRNCRAHIAAGYEAYGLTPVEAAIFGKASIALGQGGLRDTVKHNETGVLFDTLDPGAIRDAVAGFSTSSASAENLAELARRHSAEAFNSTLQRIVSEEARNT